MSSEMFGYINPIMSLFSDRLDRCNCGNMSRLVAHNLYPLNPKISQKRPEKQQKALY